MKLITLRFAQHQYDAIKLDAKRNFRTVPQHLMCAVCSNIAMPETVRFDTTSKQNVAKPIPLASTEVDEDLDGIDFDGE